jgi:hypothetical protein
LVYSDSSHLHGPLGLLLAPNGDLITANGDAINPDPNQPSELVEFTPNGRFVAQMSIDPSLSAPFGIALQVSHGQVSFAAVNDNQNKLEVWTFNQNQDEARAGDSFDSLLVITAARTEIQETGVQLPVDLTSRGSQSPLALLVSDELNGLGTLQQPLPPAALKSVPRPVLDLTFADFDLERLD